MPSKSEKSSKTNADRKPFAKKSLGQNFLADKNYIQKIIESINPQINETIIEIGPGRGALTKSLIASGANIVAIELDTDLIPVLQNEFGKLSNFTLIEGDALKTDFREISESYKSQTKLVANLPYYISTAILQKLIEQNECFSCLVLMLQREVVERITAEPGSPDRGFLSVLTEVYCKAEKLFDVPPAAFRPVPKVWSAVVKLTFKDFGLISSSRSFQNLFRQIISAGFAQRRKTIFNNLRNGSPVLLERDGETVNKILELANVEPQQRAETLTLDQWMKLTKVVQKINSNEAVKRQL